MILDRFFGGGKKEVQKSVEKVVPGFKADNATDGHYLFPFLQGTDEEIGRLLEHHRTDISNASGNSMSIEEYLQPYMEPAIWEKHPQADEVELLRIGAAKRIATYRKLHPKA